MNQISAEQALEKLKEGNKKYISSTFNPGNISKEIRIETSDHGQHPYAVVVACSDSREIPEAIFTCGIGEIFTVRVAGNVVSECQMGSVEYAVEHLGIQLVVILGHTDCGAVGAALEGHTDGRVGVLTRDIIQAIKAEKDPCKASIRNILFQTEKVQKEFPQIKAVPALYNIN
ncbi:MAG: carbonic anhydrase, partial [Erysipelotrichaceae bacterium]|nr:carbonic anhydrase [Erysipelotrichaceae bacterium]